MERRDDNREGIGGMANPGRYGIERVAYWLMRLSGLGLLVYFIAHIYETSSIIRGEVGWNELMELTSTTEAHIVLTIVIGMCVFHTVNGIRVMLGHGGVGVGRPARPRLPVHPRIPERAPQDNHLLGDSAGRHRDDLRFHRPVWCLSPC